jgi:predicted transcriptional regulator
MLLGFYAHADRMRSKWVKNKIKRRIMKIDFATTLRRLMKERGIKNQLELAGILDIRQSQISNWLNGKSLPGYHSLRTLCKGLNVLADDLLDID